MEKEIKLRGEFRTWGDDYSDEEYKNFMIDGMMMALDVDGRRLPYCGVVSVCGGKVDNLFEVRRRSVIEYMIKIFGSDEDMEEWVRGEGERVIDCVYTLDWYIGKGIKI